MQLDLVQSKLADSTRRAYGAGWRWWELFCRRRKVEPLRDVREANRAAEQALLLDFLTHLWKSGPRSPGTIKTNLSAVRSAMLAEGFPDPTCSMPRLWMALGGLKKCYGDVHRKKPVTVAMINTIRDALSPQSRREGALAWAAVLLAFMFLLRASEYVGETAGGTPLGPRGLRGRDVVARQQGRVVGDFADADEIVLTIRGSKTDKYNRGETRNHFKTENPDLCVVTALAWYQWAAPDRFVAPGHLEPLFTHQDGRPLNREEVQGPL